MTLFMTLLVRNEQDVLMENILYHLEQGVDHFLITDNLSTDKTKDIIDDFVKKGVATYIYQNENNYNQAIWVSKMAQMAYENKADWIIHSDADEFWFPPESFTLKQFIGKHIWSNILYVDRYDFVAVDLDGLPFWKKLIYKKKESLTNLGNPIGAKVIHKAYDSVHVQQGNHDVEGIKFPRKRKTEIEILHFPLRSKNQYLKKIINGGEAYSNNKELPFVVGDAWRSQYAEYKNTGTINYLEQNIYSKEKVDRQLSSGNLILDLRLKNFLEKIISKTC